MITLTYYEVGDCYDCEDRGPFTVIARFKNIDDANLFKRGKGNYSNDAKVHSVSVNIAETILEHLETEKQNKKVAALKKLTKEEIELLGIK